ncbi:MAG: SDR family oxidoreductase [Rhodospirillales bacterium]|nr:SDR family oxidoreductase [Rhodospirillales bacterium]
MFEDLRGASVLITGSSTGIGAATARRFGRCGAKVVIHGHPDSEIDAGDVAEDIRTDGGKALAIVADITDPHVPKILIDTAIDEFGALDVLINNAGGMVDRVNVVDSDDDVFDRIFDLNARQVVSMCRAAIPHFEQRMRGAIINTSSAVSRSGGDAGDGFHAGAEAFVENLTRTLAKELAPIGVRVNAVAPGIIDTAFHHRFNSPEGLEYARRGIPMQRLGTAEDCAGAYLFLASEELSGYITGEVISVNGGLFMA